MDIGTFISNPFLLDLSQWSGIIILLLIIALGVYMFGRKIFVFAGVLSWFVGVLLMYNGISWLIAIIPLILGTIIVFGGGKR